MGIEYKISFPVPDGFDTTRLQRRLPVFETPAGQMPPYDFALEADGFYFIDHMGNTAIVAQALRVLIDEALSVTPLVQISEL